MGIGVPQGEMGLTFLTPAPGSRMTKPCLSTVGHCVARQCNGAASPTRGALRMGRLLLPPPYLLCH